MLKILIIKICSKFAHCLFLSSPPKELNRVNIVPDGVQTLGHTNVSYCGLTWYAFIHIPQGCFTCSIEGNCIIIPQCQRSLQWRHNERDGVSNYLRLDCLFRRRSKKTPKLRATILCKGESTGDRWFPSQRASNAEMFPFDDVIMVMPSDNGTCKKDLHLNIAKRVSCRWFAG